MTHISRGLLLATRVLPAACRGTGVRAVERVEVSWPGSVTAPEMFAGVGLDAIWLLEATTGRATAVEQAAFRLGGR